MEPKDRSNDRPVTMRRRTRRVRAPLGTFQYITLIAIQRLVEQGREATVGSVEKYLAEHLKLPVDLAQIYVTSLRLKQLKYVSVTQMPLTKNAKRMVRTFRVSKAGAAAIKEAAQFFAAAAALQYIPSSDIDKK